jgi:GT2 family glycosyltransferase
VETKISVSVVTYNNESTINECIDSLITFLPKKSTIKVYVIDNCSQDGTYNILRNLSKKYDLIKISSCKYNLGYGRAQNTIISKLESDYHLFCNPDIILNENSLNPLIKCMEKDDKIGVVAPKTLNLDGSVQRLNRRYPGVGDLFLRRSPEFLKRVFKEKLNHYEMSDLDDSLTSEIPCISGALVLCRTPFLKKINGFDNRYFLYFEDFDMTRSFQKNGYKTLYCPDSTAFHIGGYASRKSLKILFIHIVSAIKYFQKWGWKF